MPFSIRDAYTHPTGRVANILLEDTFRGLLPGSIMATWFSEGKVYKGIIGLAGGKNYLREIGRVDGSFRDQVETIREITERAICKDANRLLQDALFPVNPVISGHAPSPYRERSGLSNFLFRGVKKQLRAVSRLFSTPLHKSQKKDLFLETISRRMRVNRQLKAHLFGPQDDESRDSSDLPCNPVEIVGGRGVIRDYELPLEALYARLLLIHPFSKLPRPKLHELTSIFEDSRRLRLDFINMLLEGRRARVRGVEVGDYELYWKGDLVFKIEGDNVQFCNPTLFWKLCTLPKDRTKLSKVIDEQFITDVILDGFVPRDSFEKLSPFLGQTIEEAILCSAQIYGNFKRSQELHHAAIGSLDLAGQFLYEGIYYLCLPEVTKRVRRVREACKHTLAQWKEVKTVHKYLSGLQGTKAFPLNKESARQYLMIIKLFDLAVRQINCLRVEKLCFEGRSYMLRKAVLEAEPTLSSCEVFTTTPDPQELKKDSYLAKPENWSLPRAGLHGKAVANTSVIARSLSERMPTFRMLGGNADVRGLVGGRGNSASGKSTMLGHHPGIQSVDYIKWLLRWVDGGRNKQIHVEGSMVFKGCFGYVIDRVGYYIIDMRLLDMASLNYYLLEPAARLDRSVLLHDVDVPLPASFIRMLTRDPGGRDPCQDVAPIVDGFKRTRKHRNEVIECIKENKQVEEYYLTYLGEKVAEKVNGTFKILDHDLYQKCLDVPDASKIEAILDHVIDDAYIQGAVEEGYLQHEKLSCLDVWKGKTIREAIESHANT